MPPPDPTPQGSTPRRSRVTLRPERYLGILAGPALALILLAILFL